MLRSSSFCIVFSAAAISITGCDKDNESLAMESQDSVSQTAVMQYHGTVVDASCGQCNFDLEGSGCDLAVRIDGRSYYVDGTKLDDHGDAHAADGFCSAVRQARVSGDVVDGRFKVTHFELMPQENK